MIAVAAVLVLVYGVVGVAIVAVIVRGWLRERRDLTLYERNDERKLVELVRVETVAVAATVAGAVNAAVEHLRKWQTVLP